MVGPYFVENGNVTESTYKRMLQYFLFLRLRDYLRIMIFQHDGVLPCYGSEVGQDLDTKFPGRSMGKGEMISSAPCSPDLTPCDYFPWGKLKDIAIRDSLRTIEELKTKLRYAIQAINEDTLQRVYENMEKPYDFVVGEWDGPFALLINS